LFARPMSVNQSVKRRVRFFQCRIIKNQNTALEINLRFGFRPKCFGIGFKAREKSSKSVVSGSLLALRLNAPLLRWRSHLTVWQ
jgi:hypothetical protein